MYNTENGNYNYDIMRLHTNSKQYTLYKGSIYNTYSAFVVFLLYMITYVLSVILAFKNNPLVGLFSLLFGIIYIPTFILISYDLDCVFSGFCDTWGYIRTILTCIMLLIIIGILIYMMTLDKELLNYISTMKQDLTTPSTMEQDETTPLTMEQDETTPLTMEQDETKSLTMEQ